MGKIDITNKFKREYQVNSYHSDLNGQLAIPSLFSFFQEIAWEHASVFGFGFNDLKEHNSFWVLSRIHVEIDALPKWTENFVLYTWPSGTDGPFALRDFVITDIQGKPLVKATSSWLIIDADSHRPRRPDAFKERMPICDSMRATNYNAPKIDTKTAEQIREVRHTVGICDIDINNHINNTKYIEWAINSLGEDEYNKGIISKIDVNYLSEGFCNDKCIHKVEACDSTSQRISIIRETDNKTLALIRVNF